MLYLSGAPTQCDCNETRNKLPRVEASLPIAKLAADILVCRSLEANSSGRRFSLNPATKKGERN